MATNDDPDQWPPCRECGTPARYTIEGISLCSQHRGLLGKFRPPPRPQRLTMWTYTFPDSVPPGSIACRTDGHDWDDTTADHATCNTCGATRHRNDSHTDKKD